MRSLSTRMTYLLKGKGPPLEVTFNLEDILKEVHKDPPQSWVILSTVRDIT